MKNFVGVGFCEYRMCLSPLYKELEYPLIPYRSYVAIQIVFKKSRCGPKLRKSPLAELSNFSLSDMRLR